MNLSKATFILSSLSLPKRKIMKTTFILLVTLLIIGCTSPSQEVKPEESFASFTTIIDRYAEDALASGAVNSLALATYKDGEVYQNYYGEMSKGENNPPNDQSLYDIASIAKIFAGSLAARAVMEEKITVEDDIRMYLDGEFPNLEFDGAPIRIKHLLSHTLGFETKNPPHYDSLRQRVGRGEYENTTIDYSEDDFLAELKTMKLDKEPGTSYVYNSTGPELVTLILAKIYNKPYKELLTDFFKELGMNNTYLQDYDVHQKQIVRGYKNGKMLAIDKNPLSGGVHGILTTLPDLVKFMQFQMKNEDVLIEESVRALFKNDDDDVWMGYLWDLGIGDREGFYYQKTGTGGGVQSVILLCPRTNYAQILLMNNTSEEAYNDWGRLYGNMENDLIEYPKLHLVSLLKEDLVQNNEQGIQQYQKLIQDKDNYYETENSLNNLGYELLAEEKYNEAIAIFKLNVQRYADSWNLYDSLAEGYEKSGNKAQAVVNYKKALQMNVDNQYDYNEQLESKIAKLSR